MKTSIFNGKFILVSLVSASLFFSCATTRAEVADNASDREIVQMAQTAFDRGRTDDSIYYYRVLIERYGMNTSIYIEGRYEIAHIYFKNKQYAKAVPIYEEIMEIYDSAVPGTFTPAYLKLASNDYSKIPAEYKVKASSEE